MTRPVYEAHVMVKEHHTGSLWSCIVVHRGTETRHAGMSPLRHEAHVIADVLSRIALKLPEGAALYHYGKDPRTSRAHPVLEYLNEVLTTKKLWMENFPALGKGRFGTKLKSALHGVKLPRTNLMAWSDASMNAKYNPMSAGTAWLITDGSRRPITGGGVRLEGVRHILEAETWGILFALEQIPTQNPHDHVHVELRTDAQFAVQALREDAGTLADVVDLIRTAAWERNVTFEAKWIPRCSTPEMEWVDRAAKHARHNPESALEGVQNPPQRRASMQGDEYSQRAGL